MIDNLQETIKKIKQNLRLAMNGIVSAHQRQNGLNYKINFGVEIPRLKEIAKEYPKDRELALELWGSSVRECKLLAIFLLPEENYEEISTEWVAQAQNFEIADHLSLNILCKIPQAITHAVEWTGRAEQLFNYCGCLTIMHCLRRGATLPTEQEEVVYRNIATLLEMDSDTITRQRAVATIYSIIDTDSDSAERALKILPENTPLVTRIKEYIAQI